MTDCLRFFINNQWFTPPAPRCIDIINPATEQAIGRVALANAEQVDHAVMAARAAFASFATSTRETRLELLNAILREYTKRRRDLALAMSTEMGAPRTFAERNQVGAGMAHLTTTIAALKNFAFEHAQGSTRILLEPIGVVGLITPWNWPMNQIICKVAPAIAAGCTMVLKPSELAPLSAQVFAEIMDAAQLPAGVFNMVQGDGSAGQALATHPQVDMMSFTGSTRAGIAVAKSAADTVKRVSQELGGKSANIVLSDADLDKVIPVAVRECFGNSGQSCNAPTRLLVPESSYARVAELAKATAASVMVGAPDVPGAHIGPIANRNQYERVQQLLATGLREGAELLAGGPGRPDAFTQGFYARPTVFGRVTANMTLAREEVFGPVLCIMTYHDEAAAIQLANDTVYGLAAYVQSNDLEHARQVARQLRAGNVYLNNPPWDPAAPFGGYKQSGNGREYGQFGMHEFLETKGVVGYG